MKVGVVGCGSIAIDHIRSWRKVGAQVLGVAVIRKERAEECASKYTIPHYFISVDDMLDKIALDIVDVCTPPQAHKEVVLKAIERGVHAFVEKPFVLQYLDAIEVIEKAKSKGVKIGVTVNYLFTPTMTKARRLINRGDLGKIKRADILVYLPEAVLLREEVSWIKSLPGKAFGEVLPHPIYLLQYIIGDLEALSVFSTKIGRSTWMMCDELQVLLKGERGLGRIVLSYNAEKFDIYIIVEGERGFLVVNPLGKIIVKLSNRWGYIDNILSFRSYAFLWLDYIVGHVPRDALVENIKSFKNYIERGAPYIFSYEALVNQVKTYEEILSQVKC